ATCLPRRRRRPVRRGGSLPVEGERAVRPLRATAVLRAGPSRGAPGPARLLRERGRLSRLPATLAVLLAMAAPAAGQGRASSIDRFAVALEIRPDRSLAVREAITFAFRGSSAGVDRRIRVRERPGGAAGGRRLDDVHVLDEA